MSAKNRSSSVRSRSAGPRRGLAAAAAALTLAAGSADGTWSIIIVDTRTGEVAIGSATCLTGFDLQANTPILITGVGGGTAQSFVDQSGQNKVVIRDGFMTGVSPDDMLAFLAGFDNGHQTRQYGIVDTIGRAATFSGTGAGKWAGGVTGTSGDLVYAVQGNVLTGQPVVDEAVAAILSTPGDLAAKLMASMEAARVMGGDGRCSCPGPDPTACGAPPPEFEKSADIAYMLIARTGDRDGANGVYRAGGTPQGIAVHDFDGDGRPDIITANSTSPDLGLLLNATSAGDPFVRFQAAIPIPNAGTSRDVAVVDLDGDGIMDLVTANTASSTVAVLKGLGGIEFAPAVTYTVPADPQRVHIADMDGKNGPDIVVASIGGKAITVHFNDGAGNFPEFTYLGAGGGMSSLALIDLDGDGDLDICFTAKDTSLLPRIYNQGGGQFEFGLPIGVGASPRAVVAADLDADGDADLVVAAAGSGAVNILLNQGGDQFARTDVETGGDPQGVAVGDFTGDGHLDIVVVRSAVKRLVAVTGDGKGNFVKASEAAMPAGGLLPVLSDLDGDGWLDLAVTNGSPRSVYIVENLGGGAFNDGLGTASGDYFMEFNIAFTKKQDPDPVFTLQEMFDEWRASLVGRPDAVRSAAEPADATLPPDGASTTMLLVQLNDWQGLPIQVGVDLAVEHAPGSAGLSTVGQVTPLGGGAFEVEITAGSKPGVDLFRVTADDGVRPVVLMPEAVLTLTPGCAADCDGSGALNIFDFLCFVNAFNAGQPSADCDGSGSLTIFDFLCFVNAFNGGC